MINVNLKLYKIFYVVAKNQHMTKAAEELHISQPAISQSIKKLEAQLGGALFLRSNRGMELTEEGKMLYGYIKGAFELIDSAENEFSSFKDLSVGEIKIGCSTTLTKLILLDAIKDFNSAYPNINIVINNDLTSNLINDLKMGRLDFVIFNDGDLKESDVNIVKIRELKQGFLYNPEFFEDKVKKLEDLNEYPLILQMEDSNTRQYLDTVFLEKGIKLEPKMEVVSQDLITEFVNIGLGIGFVLIDLGKRKFKYLKELAINKEIPEINVYLATNRAVLPTFASKTFMKYL